MGCQDEIKHRSVELWDSLPQDATAATDIWGERMHRITGISQETLTEHLWLRRPHATKTVFWESIPTDLPVTRRQYKIRAFGEQILSSISL